MLDLLSWLLIAFEIIAQLIPFGQSEHRLTRHLLHTCVSHPEFAIDRVDAAACDAPVMLELYQFEIAVER